MKRFKLRIAEGFKKAIKDFSQDTGTAHYIIAVKAKIAPCTLSYMLNDTMLFFPEDQKVKRLAKVVGYKDECFVKEII